MLNTLSHGLKTGSLVLLNPDLGFRAVSSFIPSDSTLPDHSLARFINRCPRQQRPLPLQLCRPCLGERKHRPALQLLRSCRKRARRRRKRTARDYEQGSFTSTRTTPRCIGAYRQEGRSRRRQTGWPSCWTKSDESLSNRRR